MVTGLDWVCGLGLYRDGAHGIGYQVNQVIGCMFACCMYAMMIWVDVCMRVPRPLM